MLNEYETAAVGRWSTNTLAAWRLREGHGLRCIVIAGGFVRYRVADIRAYLADATPRKAQTQTQAATSGRRAAATARQHQTEIARGCCASRAGAGTVTHSGAPPPRRRSPFARDDCHSGKPGEFGYRDANNLANGDGQRSLAAGQGAPRRTATTMSFCGPKRARAAAATGPTLARAFAAIGFDAHRMDRLGPTAMASRVAERDPLTNIRRGELKRFLRHNGVSDFELCNRVEDILAERQKWTAVALGGRIGLTFEKKLLLGIRTIQCMDQTPAEVREHFRERKRARDRIRKKRRRQMAGPADSLSVRGRDLLAVLDGEWI